MFIWNSIKLYLLWENPRPYEIIVMTYLYRVNIKMFYSVSLDPWKIFIYKLHHFITPDVS